MKSNELKALELILNKRNLSMYKSDGGFKSTKEVLDLIQMCWRKSFTQGRVQLIGILDENKEHINDVLKGNIEN